MSDFGIAKVTVQIDARTADREVRDLLRAISQRVAQVRIEADARNIPRTITSAVDAADTSVEITGDGRELTGEVEGAVDAADTHVEVTGDAKEVTGSIDGAVDAADSHVEVTADAPDVTGTIDAAVDAADTHVEVTADPGPIERLTDAGSNLGLTMGTARLSILSFANVVRGGIIAAGAKQLYDMAQAASAVAESQSKANAVFRQSVDVVNDFARESAESVGLASQAATEAAGTFGNLFTAMGLSRQEAADLSPKVIQLGADLASFNNLAVDETLERIRSGLVGEIEPLRQLGISFNAAQVEAKAMSLGLADASGEVSEGAKVQARWALILEQSTNASGDFARTSEGLANQQRILRAEFQNATADIGQAFLPLMLDLVHLARDEGVPAFQELATAGGRVLVASLSALIPLLGSTTRILLALEPAITAVAAVIDAIPDPILQMLAALVLVRRVAGPLGTLFQGFGARLAEMGRNAASASASTLGLSAAFAAVTLALTIWGSAQAEAARNTAEIEAQTDAFASALGSAETASEGLNEALRNLIESGEEFQSTLFGIRDFDVAETLRDAGLTVEQFNDAIVAGGPGLDRLRDRLRESGEAGAETAIELGLMEEGLQASAEQAIDAAVALGTYTEHQADAAVEANTARDGTVNYAGALDQLKTEVAANADAEEAHAAALAETNTQLQTAVQRAPGLADALRAIRVPGGNAAREINNLALAIANADLSSDELEAIASQVGIDLDVLSGHVEEIRGVIEGLQSTAAGAIPGLDSIAGQIDDLAHVTSQQLRDTLQQMYDDVVAFNDNIALVMQERPLLAGIAAQAPEFAALIAGMIRDGKDKGLDEYELLAAGIQTETANLPEIIRQGSPALIAQLEELGLLGTDAVTRTFHPETPTRTATQAAQDRIRRSKEGIKVEAEGVGKGASEGYAGGIKPVPETSKQRMAEARRAINAERELHRREAAYTAGAAQRAYETALRPIDENARRFTAAARARITSEREPHRREGRTTGQGAQSAYAAALRPVDENARRAMAAARERISQSTRPMYGAGRTSGLQGSAGFKGGLSIPRPDLDRIIKKWRTNIVAGIGVIFEEGSPSRLMERHGRLVAAGFLKGIALDRGKMNPIIEEYMRAFGGLGAAIGGFIGRGVGGGPLTGLEDRFESIVRTILRLGGGQIYLASGYRSSAQQAQLYARYLRGEGNLAAPPGSSYHERGLAVDWGGNRALYTRLSHMFGLKAPVRGEAWHWQPGWTTNRSYYATGLWQALEDELAGIHRGEMVVPAATADVVRSNVGAGRSAARSAGVVIEQVIIQVPSGTADPFAFGRAARRGFDRGYESSLAQRRIVTDARTG